MKRNNKSVPAWEMETVVVLLVNFSAVPLNAKVRGGCVSA